MEKFKKAFKILKLLNFTSFNFIFAIKTFLFFSEYSTEIVIQGYNSSLTMLGGGNSGGGIQNDATQNNIEDSSQVSSDMDDEIPF